MVGTEFIFQELHGLNRGPDFDVQGFDRQSRVLNGLQKFRGAQPARASSRSGWYSLQALRTGLPANRHGRTVEGKDCPPSSHLPGLLTHRSIPCGMIVRTIGQVVDDVEKPVDDRGTQVFGQSADGVQARWVVNGRASLLWVYEAHRGKQGRMPPPEQLAFIEGTNRIPVSKRLDHRRSRRIPQSSECRCLCLCLAEVSYGCFRSDLFCGKMPQRLSNRAMPFSSHLVS